jgi:heat shock protein HslJ
MKVFESVITLTDMAENELRTYLVENSPWKWVETTSPEKESVTPAQADAFTLTFGADGEVNGTTDCNNFSGTYSVKDKVFSFGSLISTLKGCEQTQEAEFTEALGQVARAAITKEGDLYLELADDAGWVVLARSVR